MLGDVIQILSISNLKAPGSRWRCTGKCSEATNASKEMTKANSLISRSRRGISRISSPPPAGMKVTSERMNGLRLSRFIGLRSSQTHQTHVGDHNRSSSRYPPGIRTEIARLHVAGPVRDMARGVG